MCDVCQQTESCFLESLSTVTQTVSATVAPLEATAGSSLEDQVTSLFSYSSWTSDKVTYGFPDAGSYSSSSTYYDEEEDYIALSDLGQDMFRSAFSMWDSVSGLTLVESSKSPTIAVAGSGVPSTAWAYLPSSGGDIWVGADQGYNALFVSETETAYLGTYEYYVALHEIGHALGLKHPHTAGGYNSTTIETEHDAIENTVMSYRSYLGGAVGALTPRDGHFPQSLMVLDIAAIQEIYGADYTTQAGDTTYYFDPDTGQMYVNGVSTGETAANVVFRTLWDGNGTDTIDLSDYTTSMSVDLSAGGKIVLDTDGTFQRAYLFPSSVTPHYATANIYMSLLANGDTRSLIENVETGSGDDVILGNEGDNVVNPGNGTNSFDGGAGEDTVTLEHWSNQIYAGLAADGALTLMYSGGSVSLYNVETIQSYNKTVTTSAVRAELAGSSDFMLLSELDNVTPTGSIVGIAYADNDSSGDRSAGDTVLGNRTVFIDEDGDGLLDLNEISTVTYSNGSYKFTGLQYGTYTTVLSMSDSAGAATGVGGSTVLNPVAVATVSEDMLNVTGVDLVVDVVDEEVFAELGTAAIGVGWSTVTLEHSFENPVVFAFVSTSNGMEIVTTRLRDVSEDSFQVRLQETSDLDRAHAVETVSYVVMEAGSWTLSDGRLVEVGTLDTSATTRRGSASVSFESDFDSSPYVFSSLQTSNGSNFVDTRQSATSANGTLIALEKEEVSVGKIHASEAVGWFAIEGGSSIYDGIALEVGSISSSDAGTSYNYMSDFLGPDAGILANIASYNGTDPASVRVTDQGVDGIELYLQEDQSWDQEVAHTDEMVNLFLFSAEGVIYATQSDDLFL